MQPTKVAASTQADQARARQDALHLRILETTDLHTELLPFDYYTNEPSPGRGLLQAASLIDALRAEGPTCLLFDNGDFLQGSPLGDFVAYDRGMALGQSHPMVDAMNLMGYDAVALGNHEFNYGLDFLSASLARANFPVLCANLTLTPEATPPLAQPWVMLEPVLQDAAGRSYPIKIGVIGFVPPQILIWDHKYLNQRAACADILTSARQWLPQMKAAGADLIVVLSHSGIGAAVPRPGAEDMTLALAQLPEVSVILAGHTHEVFPAGSPSTEPLISTALGLLAGKPAVMAGSRGSHVGVIDLWLSPPSGREGWRLIETTSRAVPVLQEPLPPPRKSGPDLARAARKGAAPAIARLVEETHLATQGYMGRRVGFSPVPLHTSFAMVTDVPAVRIVAEAQRAHIEAALRGSRHEGLPVLSAAAPFRAGGRSGPDNYTHIAAGPLALRHVAGLYIYPNVIRALRLTGQQIANWLERAAGAYLRIRPGEADQPLVDPDFPSYSFDMIWGLTYRIDPTQPARYDHAGQLVAPEARRIAELCHAGMPLDPAAEFILATTDYRAHGGGTFPGADGRTVIHESAMTNREILLQFIVARGIKPEDWPPAWRLAPLPGTSVLLDTSPAALDHLGELAALAPEPITGAPPGFQRLRLHL